MVLRTLDADRKPGKRPRRVRRASHGGGGAGFAGDGDRRGGIRRRGVGRKLAQRSLRRQPEEQVERALRSLNRVLHGHRIASHDPYVREVTRSQAYRVRIGFGTGDELLEATTARPS